MTRKTRGSLIYLLALSSAASFFVLSVPSHGLHVLFLAVATAIAGLYTMNADTAIKFAMLALVTLTLAGMTLAAKYLVLSAPPPISWITLGAVAVGVIMGLIGIACNASDHIWCR